MVFIDFCELVISAGIDEVLGSQRPDGMPLPPAKRQAVAGDQLTDVLKRSTRRSSRRSTWPNSRMLSRR